ncbi:putative transcriptional regulator [Scheffersomyces stipitis CBS 6054]|uniref:Putative transcriptional regulator n=1 Tax=Scheffersomyces stipitis (strain ATCC 58785 / CBS 6054 / NBRC 10063 / NRRL Y-11545) TaxID=322104 RepID=A3LX43_PICST|nr:putative transcriptional regulator [Scheffersomyces stipitis CBS 6054]ABN67401.2 putative transcriptional regulator [Scheffersomyces stipitis CBS 6054]
MYLVLDVNSLETVESRSSPTSAHIGSYSSKRILSRNIILGPTKRSRNGCLNCRKRKKKCDESFPTCGSCKYRGAECIWRDSTKFKMKRYSDSRDSTKKSAVVRHVSTKSPSEELSEAIVESQDKMELSKGIIELVNDEIDQVNLRLDTSEFTTKNIDFLMSDDFSDFPYLSPTTTPIFNPFRHLDDKAKYFLDGFIHKVARNLCIGPDWCNYFLKTFYQMAEQDKSVSFALASWGGLFLEGSTDATKSYMIKAYKSITERFPNFNELSKEDIYILLNFFLIGIGVHVCAGDVSQWNILFKQCIEVIQKNGGLSEICRMFDYSNDIKWLISDVQFHDIMSSRAFSKGTILPMEEYNTIFQRNKILELGNYGLDPLQGCIQPIYLLLGEILQVSSDLKFTQHCYIINLRILRQNFYNEMEEVIDQLKEKLKRCQPNIQQMEPIIDDKHEVELHLTLFEVYSYTCQLSMNYQIKGMPASSAEMQSILVNAVSCIDILVDTKLVSSLSLSLLLCGITCCTATDRLDMEVRIKKIQSAYEVANLTRMVDIIKEVWKRNSNGNVCIDWVEVCNEKDWNLSVC